MRNLFTLAYSTLVHSNQLILRVYSGWVDSHRHFQQPWTIQLCQPRRIMGILFHCQWSGVHGLRGPSDCPRCQHFG